MEKANLIKIQNVESENISNISDYQCGINIHSFYLETINNNINALRKFYQNNIKNQEKSIQNKINSYFSQINSIMNLLSEEKDNILLQYECALKKNEQKIRVLYSDIFNLKVKNTFLENNIDILLKKEKEYRLVKEKTGVVVENGTIVYNDRKENEIFILRKENSTLKNVIIKNEKELNEIKEKYKNDKEKYENQIKHLNHKLNLIKYKFKQSNVKTKGKSTSNININNDTTTPNLKLNFTINSNSLNKGSTASNNGNNNCVNKSNTHDVNNNSSSTNKKNSKKKLDTKIDKKNRRNLINLDGQNISLIHYQSTGHLNLKNKIINKLKKINQNDNSRSNHNHNGLNLSNVNNKSATTNNKLLCLTPHNNDDSNNNQIVSYQTFQKISGIQKKNKIKIKNCNILKNSSNNQNININNNFNEIKIIYKNKSKNKVNNNVNHRQYRLNNELTWSQNQLINNSVIPNSPFKMNQINIKNKNMKSNKNLKSMNITNSSKNYGYAGINTKRQRNMRNNNAIDKNSSIMNKFSLTSIRRKNTINTYIHDKNNNSPNSNNLK